MKKTIPDINPDSQNIAELQAMVKALMSEKKEWQQERQSLIEQFKLALDRQFAKRSEALKPYNEAQGDFFNEVECEAEKVDEKVVTTTTTTKRRGKRKPLPKDLPRETVVLDFDEHDKQCPCCQHANTLCIKSGKTVARNWSSYLRLLKSLNTFVLNTLTLKSPVCSWGAYG